MCEGEILETIYHHNLVNQNTKHFSSSYASVHFFYNFAMGSIQIQMHMKIRAGASALVYNHVRFGIMDFEF